ncbi:hypothetical protein EDB85DRAFT_1860878 [Lactarius pseudohatsudake]|nr:hypothetical protein EDB85DRAFT_1860878 [Lactarius pseudohatsudake]
MAKKSDKARGICYKPFPHVNRSSIHPYIDPSSIHDGTQAVWTIQCVLNLISFTVPHLASAGDGHKLTVSNQKIVTKQLNEKIIVGGKKKPSSVQNKLNDLLSVFQTVDFLENRASGLTYTQTSGCNIMTPEEDATWEVLFLQYPNAAPFRNCGWDIYEDVKKLCPNKAKGTHSFYPSNGTQGIRDPTSTEASQGSEGLSRLHGLSPEWDDMALGAAFQPSPPGGLREVWSGSVPPTKVCPGCLFCDPMCHS